MSIKISLILSQRAKTTTNTVKSFLIRWTFNFVFSVDRAIHEFKIPIKYLFTLVVLRIIRNP